jgi:hypothetical protein
MGIVCNACGEVSLSSIELAPFTAPHNVLRVNERRGPVKILPWATYDLQAYGPTPFSPRDSQGSCQSAEQGDYKRLIYLYSLATQTLTTIKLENN